MTRAGFRPVSGNTAQPEAAPSAAKYRAPPCHLAGAGLCRSRPFLP